MRDKRTPKDVCGEATETLLLTVIVKLGQASPLPPPLKIPLMNRLYENEPVSS